MKKEYIIYHSENQLISNYKSEYETDDIKFLRHPIKVIFSYVPNRFFLSDGFIRCFGAKNYYNGWTSGIRNLIINFKHSVNKIAATRYYLKIEKHVERNRQYQTQLAVKNVCNSCGRAYEQSGYCNGGMLHKHPAIKTHSTLVVIH